MAARTVLIIENDADLRRNVAEALELEGYEPLLASNGQEALELLHGRAEGELPGCILLDLMMPVMDGRTFMEALRRELPDTLSRFALVVWTASGREGEDFSDLPLAVDVLKKPVELDVLLEAIGRHCGSAG